MLLCDAMLFSLLIRARTKVIGKRMGSLATETTSIPPKSSGDDWEAIRVCTFHYYLSKITDKCNEHSKGESKNI